MEVRSSAQYPAGSILRQARHLARVSGPLWVLSLMADRLLPFGVLGWWPDVTVSSAALRRQLQVLFGAWGMSAEHSSITVDHILYADLRGIDSHGCSMLAHYHRLVIAGAVTMKPAIHVVRDSPTTALLDGGGGLGHVAADMAMKLAIEKCRAAGMGAVAVRNSGHYGAAGAYASMALQAGFLGLATTSTWKPAVVPTHGREAQLGTNPIAMAAPAARRPPFVLDMATSAASLGRMTAAWRKGRSIPSGWAYDVKGRPITSGRRAAQLRRLAPLGSSPEMSSHKGYGLAVAVEILSSILPGVSALPGESPRQGEVGHFFLAIDPQQFRAAGEFEAALDGLIDRLHSCPPLDPAQPVLVAGDPERQAYAERVRDGIPLARAVVEDLRAIAHASGVPFTLDR